MPNQPKRRKPVPKAPLASPPDKTIPYPPNTKRIHGRALPGGVYRAALVPILGDKLAEGPDPSAYAQAVLADMAPRDAVEEMLIAQMLFAHARVMRLTALANQQTALEPIRTIHEYADRASNTYRRLMLALAEYRRPPRTGDTFAVVKQANIAGQQVIQNHENSGTNATNEQGCGRTSGNASPATPALSANADRVGVPAIIGPARHALDAIHRPADAGRQDPIAAERNQTR
jgi:hypothetical protein